MTAISLVTAGLAALAVGLLLQPVVLRILTAAAVMDTPSERSSHMVATPRGGGIAVVVAAALGLLLPQPTQIITVPLVLFAAIGLAEDLRGIGIVTRLGLQAGAGLVAGFLLVPTPLPIVVTAWLVTAAAFWLTAYVNAFNFMDGINGISAVHAALAGAVYVWVGLRYDLPVVAAAGVAVAAAAVTFLPWNAGRARMFLGDVGSYGLGGALGAIAVYGLLRGVPVEAAMAPLALYLADTGWTLARRWYQGEAWSRPHRSHVYQRLTDLGWSHQRVTAVTALAAAAVCGCALAATRSTLPVRILIDAAAAALLIIYLASPRLLRTLRLSGSAPEERRIYV